MKSKLLPLVASLLASSAALLVTGCGAGPIDTSAHGHLSLAGHVHGGQQPINNAQVHLYAAGTSGNFSAAQDILTTPVFTDKNGFFGLTSDYTCTSPDEQLYLVSEGGDPGGGVNTKSALAVALGSCQPLLDGGNSTYIWVNEVTTAAAAWALGGFASGPANVGASSTNLTGISNAMRNATLLANTADGTVVTSTSTKIVESDKVLALADALATCVNSNGTTNAGSNCAKLFAAATPAGGSAPNDTFTAALNIVHHPDNNVAGVWNTLATTQAFPTGLTQAPSDWTMSVTTILSDPSTNDCSATGLAFDVAGTAWVACGDGIAAVTPQDDQATFLLSGQVQSVNDIRINSDGHIWFTDSTLGGAGHVGMLTGPSSSPQFFTTPTMFGPASLAISSTGDVFVSNQGSGPGTGSVDEFAADGSIVASDLASTQSLSGGSIVPDTTGGAWVVNSSAGISSSLFHIHSDASVVPITTSTSIVFNVVNDVAGNVWAQELGMLDEFSGSGPSTDQLLGSYPSGFTGSGAIDAGGTLWNLNSFGTPLTPVSTGSVAGELPRGASLSSSGGYGTDAGTGAPKAIAVDASGNVWVGDDSGGHMVMFLGLATPTATPMLTLPVAP